MIQISRRMAFGLVGTGVILATIAGITLYFVFRKDVQEPTFYPRKSTYIAHITDEAKRRVVEVEIPFGIHSVSYSHTQKSTKITIRFKGNFDPSSTAYQLYGYYIEIYDLDYSVGQAVWYGHNLIHTAIGMLEENQVALVRWKDGTLLAKGTIEIDAAKKTLHISVPNPYFEPAVLYLYYMPSKIALEEGYSGFVGRWSRYPNDRRLMRRKHIAVGQVKWKE